MKYSIGRKKTKAAIPHFHMMGRALVVFVLFWFGFLEIAGASDSQVYHWTDEKGVRHFSNLPPETPVEGLKHAPEIPHDPEADQARMREDEAWLKKERQRAEQERRRIAEEKAAKEAKEAEEKQLEAERQEALEEARRQAEIEREEAREQRRSTADKSIFVNPGDRIPGITPPPRPTPLPSGGDG
jgi:hypothetical protein